MGGYKYIVERLGVGRVFEGDHFSSYVVSSQSELLKIFTIYAPTHACKLRSQPGRRADNNSLNTTKNLNYLLFKKGFNLYINRELQVLQPN